MASIDYKHGNGYKRRLRTGAKKVFNIESLKDLGHIGGEKERLYSVVKL
jgi:hypothetical protein